ncbi:MAG: hypothetical protein P1V97_16865 [Planctomycetota bacterium]|nr:hypothetical protein [Planctomycetota bacterium]
MADISTGYLALKTHYAADYKKGGTFAEEFYDLSLGTSNYPRPGGDGYTNTASDTLLETRFDFYRSGRSMNIGGNLYTGISKPDQFPAEAGVRRIARAAADVADGRFQAATPTLRPNNDFYSTQLTSNMAAPIPMALQTSRDRTMPYWLTSSTTYIELEDRWYFDFIHADGLYSSDHRRRPHSNNSPVNLNYLTYRATYREDRPIGSALPPQRDPTDLTSQTAAALLARRLRGTDKDWSERGNMNATKGIVSFWYKPDFDWSLQPGVPKPTPRYCGFFSSTHVAEPKLEIAQPGQYQGDTNSATDVLESRSFRGTQMFFTRKPDGALRFSRLYFEVVGDQRGAADANISRELSRIVNPYYNLPKKAHGQTEEQELTKEYLTLAQYKAEVEKYYTIVNKSISMGTIQTQADWAEPYFFPWPPQECFLPRDATQYSATPNRQQIDLQMNASAIKTARYDSFAGFSTNRNLLSLKKGNWYLFTVAWDDAIADENRRSAMWIDGQELTTITKSRKPVGGTQDYEAYDWALSNQGPRIRAPQISPPVDPAVSTAVTKENEAQKVRRATFVRLNQEINMAVEDALRDQLTVGGFRRRLVSQGQGAGLFKHSSKPTEVSLSANGTMDDFVVYGLDPNRVATRLTMPDPGDHGARPRYFETGRWTQRMPEFVSVYDSNKTPIRILGAYFEGYMPYQKANVGATNITYDTDARIQVEFFTSKDGGALGTTGTTGGGGGGGTPAALVPVGTPKTWGPGGSAFLLPQSALADTSVSLAFDLNADESLIYRVSMRPGTQPRGTEEKEGISTPIFDSLTVVYQLPQRKVLIKERVFD